MTALVGLKLHRIRYSSLLAEVAPTVPRTEKENERLLAEIEKLMVKGEKNLSPEEDALLELLTQLVETFEKRVYPREKTSPAELVAFLLEQRGLSPSDLWPVLGSKGRVSEILSGKREVSKDQAKRLGAFFHISPAAFI
jgi:HTH-type transcriptional regulator/antitoxin HigA